MSLKERFEATVMAVRELPECEARQIAAHLSTLVENLYDATCDHRDECEGSDAIDEAVDGIMTEFF